MTESEITGSTIRLRVQVGQGINDIAAVSNAWMDGGCLRAYRHAPNAGSRKSWAAGDAAGRAVRLALLTLKGEMGYSTVLSAPVWGFSDALFKGQSIRITRDLGSYVMENILFKVSFPAEFHAQTAVEAALRLHPSVAKRLDQVDRVLIETQEAALRIIDKTGPLNNPADRDHCLQYVTAVGLIFGELTAEHYEDRAAQDGRIDALRGKMTVKENPLYSSDYQDPEKRSIANAVQVFFSDGSKTEKVEVEFPLGHRRRRQEGLPLLLKKFEKNIAAGLAEEKCRSVTDLFRDPARLDRMPVDGFMELFVSGS